MKKAINQSTSTIIVNTLAIIFIAGAIFSFLNVMSISNKVDQANLERFELTFNANRFMDGSSYLTNEVRAFAVTGNQSHYDNYWEEINTLKNRDIGLERMKEIGIKPEEESKIDAMSALSNNLVPLESAAMDMTMQGRQEEAIQAVYGAEYYATINQILSIKEEFLSMLDQRAENQVNALILQAEQLQKLTLLLILITAAMQVINVTIIMLRTILPIKKLEREMEEIAKGNFSSAFSLKPDTSEIGRLTNAIIETKAEIKTYISDISHKLQHIAAGDLNLKVDLTYVGEFEPIREAMVTILDSLNETISQINASSQLVASGSNQISQGAQSLAQASMEQSATVQQLSGSILEISQKTRENADMAEKAANLANTIMQSAEKGTYQMDEMMNAVNEINQASQSINKVIKVIDDIAFQTNILALNAAVEAARAGQHGKGFAVVAEEVRNLAAKSAEAAKDTGSLISNSMEKAKLGAQIAEETASSLSEIVSGIGESNRLIGEIAHSSQMQNDSIRHITSGVDQVARVIQQNSATAQQSAASAEELSGQSSLLEKLVAQFKLRNIRATSQSISVPVPPQSYEKLHKTKVVHEDTSCKY